MNVDSYIKYYAGYCSQKVYVMIYIGHDFSYKPSAYSTHDSGAIVKEERVKMSDSWIKKDSVFYTAVKSCYENLIVKYKTDFPLFTVGRTTDFRINKYDKGGFMSKHGR